MKLATFGWKKNLLQALKSLEWNDLSHRAQASPGPGSSEGFVNDTEDDDFGGTVQKGPQTVVVV